MNIVFARTRTHYDSYIDRNRLIELSGFPLRYIDEIDYQRADQVVIVSPDNGERDNIPRRESRQSTVVHWNLERPSSAERVPEDDPIYDETWVSDRALAESYGARYVFLAGHRAFGEFAFLRKDTDFISLCANFGRRVEPLYYLRKEFTCADNPNGTWHEERNDALKRSWCLVNIHQDTERWHEPFRFLVAASYCLPIISERCANTGYFVERRHYLAGELSDLPALVRTVRANPSEWYRMAAAAWRLVCCDHTFRGEVELAVKAMTGERVG